jgi:hypothetical protein
MYPVPAELYTQARTKGKQGRAQLRRKVHLFGLRGRYRRNLANPTHQLLSPTVPKVASQGSATALRVVLVHLTGAANDYLPLFVPNKAVQNR